MGDGLLRRAARAAIVLWVGAFIGFLGTSVTTYHEPLRVLTFWTYAAPVSVAAVACVLRRPMWIDMPVVLACVLATVVAVLSVDRVASLEAAGLTATYGATFLVACRLASSTWRSAVALGVCLPTTIWLTILAAVWLADRVEWMVLGGGFPPPHIAGSAHMWLGTDLVAVLLLVSVPFYPWIGRVALRRTLLAVTAVASLVVVPLSDARTTWVAAILAAAFFLLTSARPNALRWAWTHRVAAGAGMVALLAVASVVIGSGAVGTLSGRTHIWQTAVSTFLIDPLSGTGPGTLAWMRLVGIQPGLESYPVFHAHNLVLQTLAEGGVLLLVGLGVAIGAWLARVVPVLSDLDGRSRLGAAVLVGVTLIVMFEDPAQLPALAVLALVLAGWTVADAEAARPPAAPRRRRSQLASAVFAAVLLGSLPFVAAASEARAAAAAAREAAVDGRWTEAQAAFVEALARWPDRAPYALGAGLAAAHLGQLEDARAFYERAARSSPGDPRPLGALAVLTDDPERAVGLLRRAAEVMARDSQYRYRLAGALLALGRDDEAALELARAAMLDPQVLAVLDGGRAGLLEQALRDLPVIVRDEAERADIDPADVLAQAAIVAENDVTIEPLAAALAAVRRGDEASAASLIGEAIEQQRLERRTYTAAVAVAQSRCDRAEADRLRGLAEIAPGGFTSLYRVGGAVVESRDHVYREMGLGDYQPPGTDRPPVTPREWPLAFVAGIGCVAELSP